VAWDPNHSPVGWYIGSYLARFIVLGEERNDDPERRFTVWENTVVVQAENLGEAYDKIAAIGVEHGEPYKNGRDEDVQWAFEGVQDVLPIYDEIKDGCEVMWAEYTKKLKNIRRRASTKEQLHRTHPRYEKEPPPKY
jgi:hypothetical protein